ncbi:glucose 1-dehydrogenase [Leucobacter sp. W1038]|uniref:glucose 1-dehydrogenase n=1 Tax=Leucobacter sp. W1038 TaxID=3438281 RepID=UPI003D9954B5
MTILDQFSLQGRRALVTGAGRGIGAGLATGFAQAGAQVALVARNQDQLDQVAAEIGPATHALPFDVSHTAGISQLVDEAETALGGGIDIVLHAAGIQHREPAAEFDATEWQRVIDINLSAPFFLSQEIGRRQLERGSQGSHIFIASLGTTLGLPQIVAYTASKSGVMGVVRTLSLEWARHGIRVNGLGPGYVQTELTKAVFEDPERKQAMLSRIPMNRFSMPEDLAGAAVFLASDASSYLTGQLMMVDGGWTAA